MYVARCLFWLAGAGMLVAALGCANAERAPLRTSRNREAAERLNEQGLQFIASREFDQAERCFRQAVECDPFCGTAHCNLGITLMQQAREPFGAAWCFRHASQLMPNAVPPRVALGQLFEKAGQYGPAEQALRDALRLSPDEIDVIGHLARIHIRQSKFTEETRSWLEIVAMQDSNEAWRGWARQQLALRVEQHDIEEGTP
jgi:Tfp pilus assembly protein PilF